MQAKKDSIGTEYFYREQRSPGQSEDDVSGSDFSEGDEDQNEEDFSITSSLSVALR